MGRRFVIAIVVAVCTLGLAGCDWAQFGSGPARWRSTAETIITPQNAVSTALKWRALGAGSSSPAVVGNRVYVGDTQHLLAFDAAGTPACDMSGCIVSPLWSGDVPGTGVLASSPAVSDGIVSVGAADGRVYAFDAAGVTNCSSATGATRCQPLWTDETGGPINSSSPAVANGVLYIGSTDGWLYAFDAHGVSSCSGVPKACEPLWRANLGAAIFVSPTVAGGNVYGNGLGAAGLDVFDAAGTLNCSGSPKVCTPLRHLAMGGNIASGPTVTGDVVYAPAGSTLYAFDANGKSTVRR